MTDLIPNSPLPYEEIERRYTSAKRIPALSGMSMKDFSRFMNETTGTKMYAAGEEDNFLRATGRTLDTALSYTGLPKAGEILGKGFAEMVAPEYSEELGQMGRTLPRAMIAGLGGAAVAGPVGAAAGFGGEAFLRSYQETGEALPSVVQGATAAALPTVGQKAASVTGRFLSRGLGKLVEEGGQKFRVGTPWMFPLERAAEYGVSQAAMLGAEEVGTQAASLVGGHGFVPLTKERAAVQILGNVPFAAYDLPTVLRGPKDSPGGSLAEKWRLFEAAHARTLANQGKPVPQDTPSVTIAGDQPQPVAEETPTPVPAAETLKPMFKPVEIAPIKDKPFTLSDEEFVSVTQPFAKAPSTVQQDYLLDLPTRVTPPAATPLPRKNIPITLGDAFKRIEPPQGELPPVTGTTLQETFNAVHGKIPEVATKAIETVEDAREVASTLQQANELLRTSIEQKFPGEGYRVESRGKMLTNEDLNKRIQHHLDNGKSPEEAVQLAIGTMQNKLVQLDRDLMDLQIAPEPVPDNAKTRERLERIQKGEQVFDSLTPEEREQFELSISKSDDPNARDIAMSYVDEWTRDKGRIVEEGSVTEDTLERFDQLITRKLNDRKVTEDYKRTSVEDVQLAEPAPLLPEQTTLVDDVIATMEVDRTEALRLIAKAEENPTHLASLESFVEDARKARQKELSSVFEQVDAATVKRLRPRTPQPEQFAAMFKEWLKLRQDPEMVRMDRRNVQVAPENRKMVAPKKIYEVFKKKFPNARLSQEAFETTSPRRNMQLRFEEFRKRLLEEQTTITPVKKSVKEFVFEGKGGGKELFTTSEADILGLDRPKGGIETYFTAKTWFTRYFAEEGYFGQELSKRVAFMERVSQVFEGAQSNAIRTLRSNNAGGVFNAMGKVQGGIIGLSKQDVGYGKYGESWNFFEKAYTLGHELFHSEYVTRKNDIGDPRKLEAFKQATAVAEALSPEQRKDYMKTVLATIIPDAVYRSDRNITADVEQIAGYAAGDAEEFLATYSGLMSLGLASGGQSKTTLNNIADMMRFGEPHLTEFTMQIYRDLAEMGGALKSYYDTSPRYRSVGIDLGGKRVSMGEAVQSLNDSVRTLLRTKEEIAGAIAQMQKMEASFGKGVFQKWKAAWRDRDVFLLDLDKNQAQAYFDRKATKVGSATKASTVKQAERDFFKKTVPSEEKEYTGFKPGVFDEFMVAMDFAERYPLARPIVDSVFKFRSMAQDYADMLLTPFMTTPDGQKMKLDDRNGALRLVKENERAVETLNKIFRWQNENGSTVMPDDLLAQNVSNLPPKMREAVLTVHKATQTAMQEAAQIHIRGLQQSFKNTIGHYLMSQDGQLSAQSAMEKADVVGNAILFQKPEDIQAAKALIGPEQLYMVTVKQTEARRSLLDLTETLQDRPGFTPETRNEPYVVHYQYLNADGKRVTGAIGANTLPEANTLAKKLASEGRDQVKVIDRKERAEEFAGINPALVEKFRAYEETQFNIARTFVGDEAFDDFLKFYQPGTSTLKEITSRRFGGHLSERKLAEGRETVDILTGIFDYIQGTAMGVARNQTRESVSLRLRDPKLAESDPQGSMRKMLREYSNSVINASPQGNTVTSIKNLIFHTFLGGNLSSLLVEGGQSLFTLAPWFTQHGAGFGGGYKYLSKGVAEMVKQYTKGGATDPDLAAALDRAQRERHIETGIIEQFGDIKTDGALMSIRNFGKSKNPWMTAGRLLASPLYAYAGAARFIYSQASHANNRVAFSAGYLFAKDRGMTPSQAYDFAVRTKDATMFAGGNAARPMFFRNLGSFTPAMGVIYSLQHYTTSMFSMMGRLLGDSLGKNPNLSPVEVRNARKALGQMLTTQAVMAGALGLPATGAIVGILQQIFPNLNLEQDAREAVASLAGDDEELGNFFGDLAMKGVITTMTGLDLSGRFGLGSVFGVDQYKGITPEAVFGPAGSMLGNWWGAFSATAQGDFLGAFGKVVPNAFRQTLDMAKNDWAVVDAAGRKLMEANEADKLLLMTGFRPRKLTRVREQLRLQKRSESIRSRELASFHEEAAGLLLDGDTAAVKQLLYEREQLDPTYSAKTGLRRIVEIAQDRTTVVDPLREGTKVNAAQAENLAKTYPAQQRPAEAQRLQQRIQLERSVGIPGTGFVTPQMLTQAQMLDRLLALNPRMSLAQAKAILRERLSAAR